MAIPSQSAAEIAARLERELEAHGGEGVLTFDADGTLWSGDVGIDLFEALLASGGIRQEAAPGLAEEARAAGIDPAGDPNETARALYAAFRHERYDEARAFSMMAWVFAGWRSEEVDAFVAGVLRAVDVASRVHRALEPILAWADRRGVPRWVVSASPRAIVARATATLGFEGSRVLAMTPALEDDRVAARLAAPPVYGDGKIAALRSALPRAPLLGAFGDSSYDAAMLGAARVPVAVDPKPGLLAAAARVPGLVSLELS